jgi:hypothetical protein
MLKQQSIDGRTVKYNAQASAVEGWWKLGRSQVAEARICPESSQKMKTNPQKLSMVRLASLFALIVHVLGLRHLLFECCLFMCW